MDQKALREKLLSIIKTPPTLFKEAPEGCEVYYRKPTIEQQGRWLDAIAVDGKPQIGKMSTGVAIAAQECACTAQGEALFDASNLPALLNAESDSWVGKLGNMLLKQALGRADVGKDSGETAAASSSSP